MNAPVSVRQHLQMEIAKSVSQMQELAYNNPRMQGFMDFFMGMITDQEVRPEEYEHIRAKLEEGMVPTNAVAKAFRENTRARQFKSTQQMIKEGAISKAQLDVGTLTNFANITGGQSLGYVSLDTQMARGTVRPNSFTLYQCLHKSGAYQVVDYWPYAQDTGGALPGSAFTSFSSVGSGTLSTSAGVYNLNNVTLKLGVNGRAITTALAAQNSFVDIVAQENINAALTVLESMNWACYYGNSTIYPNQFNGLYTQILAQNTYNWNDWMNNTGTALGLSNAQGLFNLIYEAAGQISGYNQYGRITHAFMSPTTAGSLQALVTTLLNNIVSVITPSQERLSGIVVDGDLQGMRTRFGEIQFPIDLYIDSRNRPAQALYIGGVPANGSYATTSSPAPVTSVTAALNAPTVAGSDWYGAYVATSGIYSYAVASTDGAMNESTLTYVSSGLFGTNLAVSGVAASGSYTLTITPSESTDVSFRVYRSGLGYGAGITTSGAMNPASFRYIGTVAANAGSAVTFVDKNLYIPGSENIFLLDLDENDYAVDFRYLLPLTKIELFAQNLYMPWAVAMIGALRLRIPKFHGMITNYIPDQPAWNPLAPNASVS